MTACTVQPLLRKTVRAFAERFGRPPSLAAAAPGRVNLIGEHTDYNDGYVLPMAIDRWAVVAADRAASSTLWAMDLDESVTADLAAPLVPRPEGGFANYLLGVADQLAAAGRLPNLDVALSSTVPIGAGLASSAAVEVAFATLLRHAAGIELTPQATAEACRRAEHRFAGTPCGIMDMLTATLARSGHVLLIDCRARETRHIPIPPGLDIVVVDTGVRRELARGDYAERRRRCEEAARGMGVDTLRDADRKLLAGSSVGDDARRAARHVIDENERTLLAAAALATRDLEALGELMFMSHASLRDLLEVSCPQLDHLVETAAGLRGARGVIGARMTGAGFGGSVVVACHGGAAGRVIRELQREYGGRFGAPPSCFAVHAAGSARVLAPSGSADARGPGR